eukprot:5637557-Prorocentrum_lima.AAC.1
MSLPSVMPRAEVVDCLNMEANTSQRHDPGGGTPGEIVPWTAYLGQLAHMDLETVVHTPCRFARRLPAKLLHTYRSIFAEIGQGLHDAVIRRDRPQQELWECMVFALPRLLWRLPHGPLRGKQQLRILADRLQLFQHGQWDSLLREVPDASANRQCQKHCTDVADAVVTATCQGNVAKASRLLVSRGLAPDCEQTVTTLRGMLQQPGFDVKPVLPPQVGPAAM